MLPIQSDYWIGFFCLPKVCPGTLDLSLRRDRERNAPDSLTSVMRNETRMYFGMVSVAAERVKAGRVRILAVTTKERDPTMSDVPATAASGPPDHSYRAWFGITAPRSTSPEIAANLNEEIGDVRRTSEARAHPAVAGAVLLPDRPAKFNDLIARDIAACGKYSRTW